MTENTGENGQAILLVDDEASILSALTRELRPFLKERSLGLLTASSAKEGLSLLEGAGESIRLVVSDLKMPGMLGSDFLLEVKQRWPEIVGILLTGFSETTEVMKAVQAGIFSYILKPWEPDYLLAELDKALEVQAMRRASKTYQRTMEEELRWAGEMQKAILKPIFLSSEAVEFRTSYRPVAGLFCGGDYYDVISLSRDRYLVLLGDVAGHGVKAAFITGMLKAIIYSEYVKNMAGRPFSPAAFLVWLNERMNFELRRASDLIISFFAGVLDVGDLSFVYANAGQNHPLLVREGATTELPTSGPGLGFTDTVSYVDTRTTLKSSDLLLLFTDGLVEAGRRDCGSPEVDLGSILATEAYGPEYHERIMASALRACGAGLFDDDVTLVSLKITR
jgi:sigma-B regulation protein RsbU (phosphoserine phosphatase)